MNHRRDDKPNQLFADQGSESCTAVGEMSFGANSGFSVRVPANGILTS